MFSIPDGPSKSPPVALAYGTGAGWQRFALWIARRDGSLAALCPVVPENARIDSEELVSTSRTEREKRERGRGGEHMCLKEYMGGLGGGGVAGT